MFITCQLKCILLSSYFCVQLNSELDFGPRAYQCEILGNVCAARDNLRICNLRIKVNLSTLSLSTIRTYSNIQKFKNILFVLNTPCSTQVYFSGESETTQLTISQQRSNRPCP